MGIALAMADVAVVTDEERLEALALAGNGIYRRADYRDDDTEDLLAAASVSNLPAEAGDERTRIWNERFYLPVLLLAAFLLPQFRGRPARRRK